MRTLDLLVKASLLTSAVLLYTSPTYVLSEKPNPTASVKTEALSAMMDDAKIQWCKNRVGCIKMSEALYFEARGEGKRGMHAVANVITNRMKASGLTAYQVITKPKQFSYLGRKSLTITDTESYRTAQLLAVDALTGKLVDITKGATHYVAPKKLKRVPKWTKTFPKTIAINDHQFYRG